MNRWEIENELTGGHPNSLGNTLEVVKQVLAEPNLFDALFQCYNSEDEVVRLRVSNAMKRIARAEPSLVAPYLDRFIEDISRIDQASAQWTLAQLFLILETYLTKEQHKDAAALLVKNLSSHRDWIVLNMTLETLGHWAKKDPVLKAKILPRVKELTRDERKSVAKKAAKTRILLS